MRPEGQRALSVRQPWAWAIVHAGKDIENRSAAAVRHGMTAAAIAIHAAKGMTREEYTDARDFMTGIGVGCPPPDDLIRGAIIGAARVVAVVRQHPSPWFFGPCGLVLAEAACCEPIPAAGALGYFHWTPGGAIEEPKPWMRAWPDAGARMKGRPPATPLFADD